MKILVVVALVLTSALGLGACNNVDRSATKGTDPTPDAQNSRDPPKFTKQVPGDSASGAESDAKKKDDQRN